jgi:endonuclease/exonuclease/phosphatase family metal-dependent hydrolase
MRYDNPNDAPNHWGARKERVAQYIKEMKFDVFGTQEVLHNQFEDLKSMLPDYEGVGVGRDDGATRGEYAAIFYNKNVFDALDSGTFWLSENPDSIGKLGWDAACVRIATWAKLQHKATGKIVMAVNTHYDHVGKEARKQSSLLIIRKIKEIVGEQPAVLTGDFNITDQTEAYHTLVSNEFVLLDAHKVAEKTAGASYTYHGYATVAPEKCSKIDFVFVTPNIKVLHSEITPEVKEALLSDHNPQWTDLEF